MLRYWK